MSNAQRLKITIVALGAAAAASAAALNFFPPRTIAAQAIKPDEFFETRVRPVLADKCLACHSGPDAKSGLRLDSRAGVAHGGSRGPVVVVPGKPEESLLIQAVSHKHATLRMPLGGDKLKDEEVAALAQWIKDGAHWPESDEEFFTAKIKPLFAAHCIDCHNADAPQRNLRLDSRAAVLRGGDSGAAVVPGDPDNSLLIKSVRQTHDRFQMPPSGKISDDEIAALEKWVRNGAAWSDAPAAASAPKGFVISREQKAFWSFQPLRSVAPPAVSDREWARSPIDRFVFARLEEKKLRPATIADKRTLIRRATYDLTGLPPTPAEVRAFVADKSPQAFAKVVDRLLASPNYGERWGRHWLDLVRYSDTAGDSSDYPVPQNHLYRDYVIDSFNQDKPYDQFVREQIAGDLLPARSEAQKWEQTIATGYLAMARRFSVRPERNMYLTIDDTIDNVGKTFLGLTVSCARCHDHKYDPISAKDYYALYGIFDSTRYPFAGSENVQEQRDLVTRLPAKQVDEMLRPYRDRLRPLDAELEALQKERSAFVDDAGEEKEATAISHQAGAKKRTLKEIDAQINQVKKRRREIKGEMPRFEKAFAVAEGEPHDARVLRRGDPKNLGDSVPRRFLEILGGQTLGDPKRASGRGELAAWLTDARTNPLAARVMVNRIWQHHFGKGLAATPSDFGKRGQSPTHPELLDYLAAQFVKSNYSIKAMHRQMMLSRTYRQASDGGEEAASNFDRDPNNQSLWKFNRRRLDAEEIRDALLAVSGALDATSGGEHPFPAESKWTFTQHKPFAEVYDTNRRSIYLMTQRIQRHPFLATFDGPDTNASAPERVASTTPLQALFMMNSQFLDEQAARFAARLQAAAATDRGRIGLAYRIALGREAAPEELTKAEDYLRENRAKFGGDGESATRPLASYLRALLSSNEFVYVD